MNHSHARALISERMDGERLSTRVRSSLEEHLEACEACRSFERGAYALRERARFEVAPAVPDLVDAIMARVGREAPASRLRLVPPRELRRRASLGALVPAVAALVVGLLVGSLVVGGPFSPPERQSAIAATQVARGVAMAASRLTAYQASFAITEYHLSPDVPVRELSMNVWFRAPERFRLDVADHTAYPGEATPNDLQLVVNGSTWASSGPAPCQFAVCPQRETVVRHRVPFSSTTPVPTDLVLPVTTLADADAIRVVGSGRVLGRDAVEVELPFERAAPLFPFLSLGGQWRPFFPNDRVDLWLDRADWFPLRWTVYPAAGRERDQWALRFGLPEEPARRAIFQVRALSFDRSAPTPGTFAIPRTRGAEDAGATDTTLAEVSRSAGFRPVTPEQVLGLDLYRVVVPPPEPASGDQTILAYTKGMSWLKLGETRSWSADAPFGPVGFHAQQVPLANGGVGYYEPATEDHGRRLSIHAAGSDLYLETNLPRDQLLRVAASLPLRGIALPDAWTVRTSGEGVTERVGLEQAMAELPFPLELPATLPPGYAFASAELVRVGERVGVNVYFQQLDTEIGNGPIRFHAEQAPALPTASSASQVTVEVDGVQGRFTPERDQLEWVRDGVYRSIDGTGLGLEELLAVADSIAPAPSPAATGPTP